MTLFRSPKRWWTHDLEGVSAMENPGVKTIVRAGQSPVLRRLDTKISTLEVQGADIGAVLARARFKLFKTYTAEDLRLLEEASVPKDKLVC